MLLLFVTLFTCLEFLAILDNAIVPYEFSCSSDDEA